MVLKKKKLTPKVIEALMTSLCKNKEEQDYFFLLTKYSQSSSAKERNIFGQKMMLILKNYNQPTTIKEDLGFTSDPLYARLLSLFSYDDIQKNLKNLAALISRSEPETLKALASLEGWGLIKRNIDSDTWSSEVDLFKVPDKKGSKSIHLFHEKSLIEAIKAFDLPVEQRNFKSLLLPMNQEDYNSFIQTLEEFSKEQMARNNHKSYRGRRMFQVNFNIYPVTEILEKEIANEP